MSQAPLRVSLVGGGSDLPEYYNSGEIGEVIGFTIKRYVRLLASLPIIIDENLVKYSKTEKFDHPSEINHPIFRTILNDYWNKNGKIELASFADIRSGTGLGSSSVFTVALLALVKSINNESFTPYSLSKDAFEIERYKLGEKVGLQDGAYGAYGGCCHFKFLKGDKIEHSTINLREKELTKINKCFFLVFTSISRNAQDFLKVHSSSLKNNKSKKDYQRQIVNLVNPSREALQNGDFEVLGEIIKESYKLKLKLNGDNYKKESALGIVEKKLNHSSICGYKLLGAGGGGFFLVIGKSEECKLYLKSVGLKPFKVELENEGCRVIKRF